MTNMVFDDAMRFRWLTEDHDDEAARKRSRELLARMPVMSYGDACAAIDSAMADEVLQMMKSTAYNYQPTCEHGKRRYESCPHCERLVT